VQQRAADANSTAIAGAPLRARPAGRAAMASAGQGEAGRAGRQAVEGEGGEAQLRQRRRGLVRQLHQAQAGDQRQQAAVGHRAGVVGGQGLAAEGEGHRLRLAGVRAR
jgi:hypothetical protein